MQTARSVGSPVDDRLQREWAVLFNEFMEAYWEWRRVRFGPAASPHG